MSDNGRPFTSDMWEQFIEDMAPEGNADVEAWKTQRMLEASQIRATVPNSVMQAMTNPPPPIEDGEVVMVVHRRTGIERYATHHSMPQGIVLREIVTDATGYVHSTGRNLEYSKQKSITRVAMWTAANKHYVQAYRGDEEHEPLRRKGQQSSARPAKRTR